MRQPPERRVAAPAEVERRERREGHLTARSPLSQYGKLGNRHDGRVRDTQG
jgi:hypothetical protein